MLAMSCTRTSARIRGRAAQLLRVSRRPVASRRKERVRTRAPICRAHYAERSPTKPGERSVASTPGRTAPPTVGAAPFNVGYDGVDNPLWMTTSDALVYFEVDTIGNVRHLHTDAAVHGSLGAGDLGGYSYTAFGKTIAPSDAGGVPTPVGVTQPFGWQGKRLIAPNLYDSRARVWSAELGAFLQPDEYVFLGRSGTLWSWPGQNPYRWRDPSGRTIPNGGGNGVPGVGLRGLFEGFDISRDLLTMAAQNLRECDYTEAYLNLLLANIAAQAGVIAFADELVGEFLLGSVGGAEQEGLTGETVAPNAKAFQSYRAELAQQEIEGAEAVGSALKGDPYHRSASFVTGDIGPNGKVFTLRPGVNLTQVPGELNGVAGRFEWIVNEHGQLTHQMFVQGGPSTERPYVPEEA